MDRMEGSDADADAVARFRAGDEGAFRTLVERHSRAVFRVAYRMTGNEQDAEDVVQEAFLRAYRNLGRFEERARFASWLHRIAANCAYDALRARARRDDRVDDRRGADGDSEGPLADVASPDPPPDRLVFSGEVRRKVGVAMARMSAVEKSAFTLRHFEGLSIEEIGRALDLDTSATKHSIFRAVRKVRDVLGGDPSLRPTA
jgi:RNA polymerase sigma-70 factor (ECF subfamily)